MRCQRCGTENTEDAGPCRSCGGTLVAAGSGRPALPSAGGLERRSVTIMFCDLVGSTALSRRLDPEELGEVLLAYRRLCTEVMELYGGYVARYVGDSLLVYFGYPSAHDDDALRAVRAALHIRNEIGRLGERYEGRTGQPLMVHVGVHTGEVVAGDFGSGAFREEAAVIGDTPNVAARLQSEAGSAEIVISDATYRLVHQRIRCERMPDLVLKGIEVPLAAYRVISETAHADDAMLDGSVASEPIGRDEELALLLKRWQRVLDRDGQVALLSGEPGIGKTALLRALTHRIAHSTGAVLVAHCSPYFANTAFFPFLNLLRRQLGIGESVAPAELASAIERHPALRDSMSAETLALVASMLSGMGASVAAAQDLTPQAQRDRFMDWLMVWLQGSGSPLVLVVEDLHWADASTLDFLKVMADQISRRPVFMLLTFRSDFRPPWPIRSHVSHLTLGRLSSGDVRTLVMRLTEGKAMPAGVLDQVIEKTDGVPLFVEEFTKMVVEAGVLETPASTSATPRYISVPDSLRGSLLARLDRHSEARNTAQIAAVIDREIPYGLLQRVSGTDDATLRSRLAVLVDAELLRQEGIPPRATYSFKHALIRDAAYQSLLKSSRAAYHKLTAEALLADFPGLCEGHPEYVAHHFSEAGLGARALEFWRTAGLGALEASANVEAAAHLGRALQELPALPTPSMRAGHEIELLIGLGAALTATRGYGSTDVEQAYARALALCENLGDSQKLFAALTGLHSFYQVRGPVKTACAVAERLVALAEQHRDQPELAQAHRRLGWSLFCAGDIRRGKIHLDRALDLYDRNRSAEHSIVYGAHPWIVGNVNSAWLEWVSGNTTDALRRSDAGLALSRELGRPLPRAYALCMSAAMYQCMGEPARALELASETVALAKDNSLPYWTAWGTVLEGWALARLGKVDEGLDALQAGLRAYRDTGAELFRPYCLSLLAEAFGLAGRLEEALEHANAALESAEAQSVHFYTAEIHRLRGRTVFALGKGLDAAIACYEASMELARSQASLAFEFRTGVDLAELLVQHGAAGRGFALARGLLTQRLAASDSADARRARALVAAEP